MKNFHTNSNDEINFIFKAVGPRTDKPWGNEVLWANGPFAGKVLSIKAGHQLSLQYHEKKIEAIMVLNGILTLEVRQTYESNSTFLTLNPGENFHVDKGVIHRMIADKTDVQIIEVSTPELDDVVRLEDSYGRDVAEVIIKKECSRGGMCCGEANPPHPCPYAEEIHNNSEDLCECCDNCMHECAMDV